MASTKVSWAPASGIGMTPKGTSATIATKNAMALWAKLYSHSGAPAEDDPFAEFDPPGYR